MIPTKDLKKRDLYLNKLIAFQDTEPVKAALRKVKPYEANGGTST